MTKKEENIVEGLIAGGIVGAALGALILKDKGKGSVVGAIAGAAIAASVKAYESAQQTAIPLVVEEDNVLYKVYADGTKKVIKKLPQSKKYLSKYFTLK